MTAKKTARKALEPPVIESPKDGDKPGVRFRVEGTGTPGNFAVAYSTKDPLNQLFGQLISSNGSWLSFLDLSQFGFYVVERSQDGTVSPRSPIVTIHLESTPSAPNGDANPPEDATH
ncbi:MULTISPECIES: hypothetical protein [unclassified Pseudomonas]|uniref:hypothetical protein n=1 Tax=unclassified Pseudomonas TaxID=196821 RepID=UPI002A371841|nr:MULTISPECIES: hypothetical protein [unclassified Pseudomonas]MDX9670668.1 hypothetical protein [Pseudomonas sp. P8_250]WPN35334.1 hypothetical protein QMK53_24535 [Pseudomonas sp. P8_139]WPN42864.1 hypothetical protein QMK55_06840 [Pseudomonas sp. P8_229]